jgi:hypothetical protein
MDDNVAAMATAKYTERVERASMAVNYVVLWRWDELFSFVS